MYTAKSGHTFIIMLLFAFTQGSVFADGYRNTPEGARAIGAFGGHRAFADDANATIHNSANLVDLERPMIQINALFGDGENSFKATGVSDKTENPHYGIPGFSVAVPLNDGKFALGFAAYVPYGRSVDWGNKDYMAAIGAPYSGTMTVADFTPNVAMRLTDSLSVGVGIDFYYGEVRQKQFAHEIFSPYHNTTTSHSEITADDTATGWNAALTWKMTEKQRLAATYRSSFTMDYHGKNQVEVPETSAIPGLPFPVPPIPEMAFESFVDAEIEYPNIIALAYGVEFTDNLRAELNVEWLEFSVYQNLTIRDTSLGTITAPQKLKDTWTFGVGGEWDFATNWTARAGYMYLQNPTPDETYGPLGPDEDQSVISLGLGYETKHHAFDLGWALGLFGGREVSGSVNGPDGFYDYDLYVLSLSYGYKF